MNTQTLILVGVGVVALLGALGAFAIAFRRSGLIKGPSDWRRNVSRETREADRPQAVTLPSTEAVVEEAPEVEEEPEPVMAAVAVAEVQRVVEVSPEESGVTRRQFFNRALAATFGSFVALLGIDMLAFFWPKVSGGFGADVDAGDVAELTTRAFTADGSVVPVFVPEARAYVVPVDEAALSPQFKDKSVAAGGLMALYQRCVHLGCRVPWCATSIGFECPCHGSKYDYIGEYFAGPAPRNLDRFVVEVKDDRLIIKTGTILETPRAPVRSVAYPQGPSCIGDIAVVA
jgi:cytochrome b6-f complex iron-sulfur subunit